MQWRSWILVVVVPLALAGPASAGLIFNRKSTKPEPTQRVPELITILKTDTDEQKRSAAAEELRSYDPKANADMVPILIDVLLTDKSASVRTEAAQTLGKLRPVSQEAGWALEQAQEKDESKRVRWQARMSLWSYQLAGYHSSGPKEAAAHQTSEPPLAMPAPAPKASQVTPPPATRKPASPTPPPANAAARPMPIGPVNPVLVPAEPPRLETPPPPLPDGPVLFQPR